MNNVKKAFLTLILIVAVLAYTVFNFVSGKISMSYLLVFSVILGIPFVNILNILIQELKYR